MQVYDRLIEMKTKNWKPEFSAEPLWGRRWRTLLFVLVAVLLVSSTSDVVTGSDFSWTQMLPTESPPARLGHAMAYDSESDRAILFGGETSPLSNVLSDQTWAYDLNSNSWENRNPSPRPSARFAQAMAYDAHSDRVILFGGWTGAEQSLETWAYNYNTNTWTNITTGPSPSAGVFVAMVYDSQADRMILFGGVTHRSDFPESGYRAETWAYDFDNATWTQRNPANSPSPRAINGMMAYDAQSDRIVLFGGRDAYGNFADTWEYRYNDDSWIQITPQTGPSARHAGAMAYDVSTDQTVLFGGYTTSGTSNETWAYDADSNTWTKAMGGAGPSARFGAATVDDTGSNRIVLFGGSSGGDETWTLVTGADSTSPSIAISSPANNTVVSSTTVIVTGTASDNVAVQKVELSTDGTTWTAASGTTTWSGSVTLHEGTNVIYARATDASENRATVHITVTVQTAGLGSLGLNPVILAGILVAIATVGVAVAFIAWRRKKSARQPPPGPP